MIRRMGRHDLAVREGSPGCLIIWFDNGFGASVVRHSGSYGGLDGLWELAVVSDPWQEGFELRYDTPITDDVVGHLDEDGVAALLDRIEALPSDLSTT